MFLSGWQRLKYFLCVLPEVDKEGWPWTLSHIVGETVN